MPEMGNGSGPSADEDTHANSSRRQSCIEHVTIHAPPFMDNAMEGWIAIIEAQFELRNISQSSTKFFNTLPHLPPAIICKIPRDILASKNYDQLKDCILSTYETSKPEMLDKLMSSTKLAGRPSLYLQEIQSLASKLSIGDDIVRHKFIKGLPSTISGIIASQPDMNLNALGKLADQILPYLENTQGPVFEVGVPSSRREPSRATSPHNRHSRSNSYYSSAGSPIRQSRSPSPRKSFESIPFGLRPFSSDQMPKVCRTHLYFGGKARTCKRWCLWPEKKGCKIDSRSGSPTPSEN